jgi:DNA-binding MarR family transcriptional regulator
MNKQTQDENRKLRQASAEAKKTLQNTLLELRDMLKNESVMTEIPLAAQASMNSTATAIETALNLLDFTAITTKPATLPLADMPTRQQGQFLAFIREYMMRNYAGRAPAHTDLQRQFNLTPPSVNSMLIRLEQRGFIRRIPGKARAIELVINPEWIPPLDRPLKF